MIKAIDTIYKGYKFRSRLEARWAVFFDALYIKYEYEQEGYVLSDGTKYLPDFYLPTFNGSMYVEVKPDGGDFSKAEQFARESKQSVWLAEGVPDCKAYVCCEWLPENDGDELTLQKINGIPNADSAYGDNRMFACPGYENPDNSIDKEDWDLLGDDYIEAVFAAKSARFEFNQTGI